MLNATEQIRCAKKKDRCAKPYQMPWIYPKIHIQMPDPGDLYAVKLAYKTP